MTKQTRIIVIVGSAVAALLIAAIIVGVVILNTLRAQAENEAYQECMARHGYAADAPAPAVADEDQEEYLQDIVAAAEACSRD
ncbi:hypothetical protein [Microbacterium sp. NPDC057658]|uniref:hypothetical protein n=1 Tax=unclassified Microbacterium TaxID=2609290 RepID=UPI0036728E73